MIKWMILFLFLCAEQASAMTTFVLTRWLGDHTGFTVETARQYFEAYTDNNDVGWYRIISIQANLKRNGERYYDLWALIRGCDSNQLERVACEVKESGKIVRLSKQACPELFSRDIPCELNKILLLLPLFDINIKDLDDVAYYKSGSGDYMWSVGVGKERYVFRANEIPELMSNLGASIEVRDRLKDRYKYTPPEKYKEIVYNKYKGLTEDEVVKLLGEKSTIVNFDDGDDQAGRTLFSLKGSPLRQCVYEKEDVIVYLWQTLSKEKKWVVVQDATLPIRLALDICM